MSSYLYEASERPRDHRLWTERHPPMCDHEHRRHQMAANDLERTAIANIATGIIPSRSSHHIERAYETSTEYAVYLPSSQETIGWAITVPIWVTPLVRPKFGLNSFECARQHMTWRVSGLPCEIQNPYIIRRNFPKAL